MPRRRAPRCAHRWNETVRVLRLRWRVSDSGTTPSTPPSMETLPPFAVRPGRLTRVARPAAFSRGGAPAAPARGAARRASPTRPQPTRSIGGCDDARGCPRRCGGPASRPHACHRGGDAGGYVAAPRLAADPRRRPRLSIQTTTAPSLARRMRLVDVAAVARSRPSRPSLRSPRRRARPKEGWSECVKVAAGGSLSSPASASAASSPRASRSSPPRRSRT